MTYLLLVLSVMLAFTSSFKLNKLKQTPVKAFPSNAADKFKPIRLSFVQVDTILDPKATPMPDTRFTNFVNKVINPVKGYFEQILKLYPINAKTSAKCTGSTTDKFNVTTSFSADLDTYLKSQYDYVFFIVFSYSSGNTASAKNLQYALIEKQYYRPVCGLIQINLDIFQNFEKWTEVETLNRKGTFFHEITHALAFTPTHYNNKLFLDEKGIRMDPIEVVTGINLNNEAIKTPYLRHKVISDLVSDYFNCTGADLYGYPLAQDSSHFHENIIANGIMRPIADNFEYRITKFMLSLFKLTGWYIVDLSYAEETLWGRNKGCNFLKLQCKDTNGNFFDEYCDISNSQDKLGCDYYHEQKSVCNLDTRVDHACAWQTPAFNCKTPYSGSLKNSFDVFESNSKCVEYRKPDNSRSSSCLISKCNLSERTITIAISNNTFSSKYIGNTPTVKSFTSDGFTFSFPQFDRFCFNIQNNDPVKSFKVVAK